MKTTAEDLRGLREVLLQFEGSQLAETAKVLLEVAERQQSLLEKLGRNAVWTDRKGICEHLGVTPDQFRAIAGEIPKHHWKGKTYMYNVLEVDEWMSRR